MNTLLSSKRSSLIILGITAVLLSRAMFYFFDDPEGPNLLIVLVTAVIVFGLSLAASKFVPSTTDSKRFGITLLAQALLVVILYVLGTNF